MPFRVSLTRRARQALDRLPEDVRRRVQEAINGLCLEPRPNGGGKLRALPLWRVRVGEYRVIFAIFDPDQQVEVVEVVRRSEGTYENL